METEQSMATKAVTHDDSGLTLYTGSAYLSKLVREKMRGLRWEWAKEGEFVANRQGPCFVFAGANSTRYNIRPWKKSDGTWAWKCANPMMAIGDSFMEFLDPVSCAVAQEMMSDAIQDFRRTQ